MKHLYPAQVFFDLAGGMPCALPLT